MTNYPMKKYKFFTGKNKVIAVSTYEGKPVRGVAKCSPEDTFDMNKGRELAAARCNEKIAEKRMRRADREYAKAKQAYAEAENRVNKMNDYYRDSRVALSTAHHRVFEILETM